MDSVLIMLLISYPLFNCVYFWNVIFCFLYSFEVLSISGAQSHSLACDSVQISARMEAKGQLYF